LSSALQEVTEGRRSRLVSNPLTAINRKFKAGRAIHDLASRYLRESSKDASDALVIAECITAAQLRLRLDSMLADPASKAADIVRLEYALRLKLSGLGLGGRAREKRAKVTEFA
jgi:hypothetical protein